MKTITKILKDLEACRGKVAAYSKKTGALKSIWEKANEDDKSWFLTRLFKERGHAQVCRLCNPRATPPEWAEVRARLVEKGFLKNRRPA